MKGSSVLNFKFSKMSTVTARLVNCFPISIIFRSLHQTHNNVRTYQNLEKTVKTNLEHPITESSANLQYTVEEVKLPSTTDAIIAGKLWQGNNPNKIPIICLHGWLDNAGTFDRLLPLIMKPDMTVLAIDFPGHGHSSHIGQLHYDIHLEPILALKSAQSYFGWHKLTLLGHSLGAMVGFIFTAIFPETIDKFIALENVRPIPRNLISELRFSISNLSDLSSKELNGKNRRLYPYSEIIKTFYQRRDATISMEGCEALMRRGAIRERHSDLLYKFSHDPRALFPTGLWRFSSEQTEELARSISCPVCFIKGNPGRDYEDRRNYDRIVQLMATNSNPVEYHYVSGTHHFHLNDPQLVAPIITQFLHS